MYLHLLLLLVGAVPTHALIDWAAECAKTTLPCFTTMKYCRSEENATPRCDFSDYQGVDLLFHQDTSYVNGPILNEYESYNLDWHNANHDYPTLLTWNMGNYSLTMTIPKGQTSMSFTPATMMETAEKGTRFPNVNDRIKQDLIRGHLARGYSTLSIGQPEDPKYRNNTINSNVTDTTDKFFVMSTFLTEFLFSESKATSLQDRLDQTERDWNLGVGIGVGIGVPILLFASFFWGRSLGKKVMWRKTTGITGHGKVKAANNNTSGEELGNGESALTRNEQTISHHHRT